MNIYNIHIHARETSRGRLWKYATNYQSRILPSSRDSKYTSNYNLKLFVIRTIKVMQKKFEQAKVTFYLGYLDSLHGEGDGSVGS
jgi:hypothetical protein